MKLCIKNIAYTQYKETFVLPEKRKENFFLSFEEEEEKLKRVEEMTQTYVLQRICYFRSF